MQSNPVVWFEIYTSDMPRARKFYEAVLQRKLEPMDAPPGEASSSEMVTFPGDPYQAGACGMLVKMDGFKPSGTGGTLVYFGSEDCAGEQSRAEAAGGKVFKPKFSIGPYGYCTLLVDTEGNHFGVHSMK